MPQLTSNITPKWPRRANFCGTSSVSAATSPPRSYCKKRVTSPANSFTMLVNGTSTTFVANLGPLITNDTDTDGSGRDLLIVLILSTVGQCILCHALCSFVILLIVLFVVRLFCFCRRWFRITRTSARSSFPRLFSSTWPCVNWSFNRAERMSFNREPLTELLCVHFCSFKQDFKWLNNVRCKTKEF